MTFLGRRVFLRRVTAGLQTKEMIREHLKHHFECERSPNDPFDVEV